MPAPLTALPGPVAEGDAPLAPRWHTAALIALIVTVASVGTLLTRFGGHATTPAAQGSRVTAVYVPLVLVQGALLAYVCRVGQPRNALSTLLGERWRTARRACLDLALALAGWVAIEGFEAVWAAVFTGARTSVAAMLPRSLSERLAWTAVAVTVGFCEEVVYRGYLQRQLRAFTGRPSLSMVLQAALFALAHAEQGGAAMARIFVYGLLFGALARWRRSLLPGITCHVGIDLASGLLHR